MATVRGTFSVASRCLLVGDGPQRLPHRLLEPPVASTLRRVWLGKQQSSAKSRVLQQIRFAPVLEHPMAPIKLKMLLSAQANLTSGIAI